MSQRIGHSASELQPDTDIVMTLKDSSVFDTDTTLENSALNEVFRAGKKIEARKLARSRGQVHLYDGEEGEKSLLSKYDDPLEDCSSRGFELSDSGTIALPATETPAAAGESLNTPKTVAAEFTTFRKPRKRGRNADVMQHLAEAPRTSMRDAFLANREKASPAPVVPSLDEEAQELQLSLSRQLRAAQKKQKLDAPEPSLPVQPTAAEPDANVFSATKEFIEAVESEKERLESKRLTAAGLTLKDTANGTTSVVNVALPSEKLAAAAQNLIEPVAAPVADAPLTRDPLTQELFMGRGLAECLQLLRQRAALKQEKKKYGRATDVKKEEHQDEEEGPVIEYRDKRGRLLSKKQAFRELCYTFHNEGPSKNKVEKLQNRTKLEQQRDALEHSKGTSSFRAQKDVMAKTKQPYLLLPTSK